MQLDGEVDHNTAKALPRLLTDCGRGRYREAVRAGEIIFAVEGALRRQHRTRKTVYRREWSIALGATRIDLAAINGTITGCEVKSAQDNFARLESQARLYSAVLDTAILVVEGQSATERASSLVPDWWGLWSASKSSCGVSFNVVRMPASNPAPDPMSIAQLLWRDEAFNVLDRRGLSVGLRRATRWRLWQALADELPLATLQREVRQAIKARPEW